VGRFSRSKTGSKGWCPGAKNTMGHGEGQGRTRYILKSPPKVEDVAAKLAGPVITYYATPEEIEKMLG
jgi:alkanesulfonate monooxygenase SsuD/methylene tetrahydromethanopterin reductase-like flavin-dependent oxidoreductase (luciferase family)